MNFKDSLVRSTKTTLKIVIHSRLLAERFHQTDCSESCSCYTGENWRDSVVKRALMRVAEA